MKVNEVLTEAKKKTDAYAPREIVTIDYLAVGKKIAAFIKKNCNPWLATTNNGKQKVYRGITTSGTGNSLAFLKTVRTDRTPKDTSARSTAMFNAAIAAVGGLANRTNSVFVSSLAYTAAEYGDVWIYMPVGDFHYTFSPEWADWTHDVQPGSDFTELLKADVTQAAAAQAAASKAAAKKSALSNGITDQMREKIRKMLKSEITHLQDLVTQYKSKNSFYDIDSWERDIKKFTEMLSDVNKLDKHIKTHYDLKMLAQFTSDKTTKKAKSSGTDPRTQILLDPASYDVKEVAKYIKVDRDIKKAFHSGNEIMLTSTEGLYIEPQMYDQFVSPLLQGKAVTKLDYRRDYDE